MGPACSRMVTRAPSSGGSVRAGGPTEPTTAEKLAEIERNLSARKPWPAFLLAGFDALDDWEACPDDVQGGLNWMASSTVGLLDITSVGPLTPICQGFKALIEAARGAVEAEKNLRNLISWCAFILCYFIGLGKEGGPLSGSPVQKCLQDFDTTTNLLAKRAKTLSTRRKFSACLCHRKDTAEIGDFEVKLRKIWEDIGLLTQLDVREEQRGLLAPKIEPRAAVPIGALSLPDSHVERTCKMEEVVRALTKSGVGTPPHMLIGMGGEGKTVLASSVVNHKVVRNHFQQGIFWIRVGQGGKDQLHALFQGLAREVGVASTDTPHGVPSDGFNSVAAVVQHLTAVATTSSLPRLVVLDDVWEREVVDTVLPTGLVLLVTTRDESVVGAPGVTRTDVGGMTEEEAVMLLSRASRNVGSPGADVQAAMEEVGRECGLLPLALAIAGSMPVERSTAQEWKKLHKYLKTKGGMLLAKGMATTPLNRVLDASFDKLGAKKQRMFLRMAVLSKGAVAPEHMLLNLWEVEDVQETRDEARGLMDMSLLQAVGSLGYRMHDMVLNFARGRIQPDLLEVATQCQAQYLGRLRVVLEYASAGESQEGFYALISLWRSVEDLSHNPQLQVGEYHTSLQVLAEDESTDAGDVHRALGRFFYLQAKYAEAELRYLRSMEITEKTLGPDHPSTAASLSNLAVLFTVQRKHAEAEPLFRRAIQIQEKTLGDDHHHLATTLNHLALLLNEQGKHAEAEPLFRRAIGIEEKVLGAGHLDVAVTLNDLAVVLNAQGEYAEAEALCLRAIDIQKKVLGPDHAKVTSSLKNLAVVFQAQGKNLDAQALYLRCISILEKALGHDHHQLAPVLHNLAGLYREQGKYVEAEALFRRAIGIGENTLGPGHHQLAIMIHNLADLFVVQGKHNEAVQTFEKALTIKTQKLGAEDESTVTTRQALERARQQVRGLKTTAVTVV